MAIQTEFIDFIVNISAIRAKYPGGWEQCLDDHANLIGGRVWYDDYLFRDGAMNPHDIGRLVERWSSLGLIGRAQVGGKEYWVDFCVHERMFGGTTLPCDWLIPHGKWSVAHVDDPGSPAVGSDSLLGEQKE
jgi:hypothetical protein